VAASAAQPLLRVAAPLGRLAVRALPANLLAAAFAAARSGRMNPWIMAGLLVYCVGVTIYATNTRRQVEVATATAASSLDATSASGSLASASASASLSSVDAEAASKAAAAGQDKKKERSEVCKVCGGTGQVRVFPELCLAHCWKEVCFSHQPGRCCSLEAGSGCQQVACGRIAV
jgi:type IV secretory pathway VirB6-like protein